MDGTFIIMIIVIVLLLLFIVVVIAVYVWKLYLRTHSPTPIVGGRQESYPMRSCPLWSERRKPRQWMSKCVCVGQSQQIECCRDTLEKQALKNGGEHSVLDVRSTIGKGLYTNKRQNTCQKQCMAWRTTKQVMGTVQESPRTSTGNLESMIKRNSVKERQQNTKVDQYYNEKGQKTWQ